MTNYAEFNRATLTQLRNELNAVLKKYSAETNLELSVGNMKFSSAEVEIKVKAKISGATTVSDKLLLSEMKALGLKRVNAKGDMLVGYNRRAYKMPFLYKNASDGKTYKCPEDYAKVLFG